MTEMTETALFWWKAPGFIKFKAPVESIGQILNYLEWLCHDRAKMSGTKNFMQHIYPCCISLIKTCGRC